MTTLDPFVTLLDLANAANPSHPIPFTPDTVTFVAVEAHPRPDREVNSKFTIAGIEAVGYTGLASFYYARHDLAADFAAAQITPTLPLDGLESWATLAQALNTRYNTQLVARDLPLVPWKPAAEGPLTFTIAPTSLFYHGSFDVALTAYQLEVPLSAAVQVLVMNGLTGP